MSISACRENIALRPHKCVIVCERHAPNPLQCPAIHAGNLFKNMCADMWVLLQHNKEHISSHMPTDETAEGKGLNEPEVQRCGDHERSTHTRVHRYARGFVQKG